VTAGGMLTVRCLGPGPVRARWYRSLAYALAATPGPSGVVFESMNAPTIPWVTVRPRTLVDTFQAAASSPGRGLKRTDAAPPLEPPRGWVDGIRYVTSTAPRTASAAYRSEVGRDLPELGPRVGPTAWLGIQTHWLRGHTGELWVARRFRLATATTAELEQRMESVAAALAEEWAVGDGRAAATCPAPRGSLRDWRRGTVRAVPHDAWQVRTVDAIAVTAEVRWPSAALPAVARDGHGVVFGSSGAGKTTFLARHAAREIASGRVVVAIDLHGDLAPAILARLPGASRSSVVAVDASDRPVPGIAALAGDAATDEVASAHLVAALKRLSPDGNDLYWGFRLERLFDSFVRLAQESGGSLLDVYDLLTDPARRDTARLTTRRPDLARFLDELAPILRRHPDFLWSAATRLSKVVLVPGLTELLAPAEGGLPVEDLLERNRSILVRVPFATLGPEAATFAGSLVLGRIYLGLASRRRTGEFHRPVLFLLDEVHGLSPRLVAEVLTESRKFGVRALIATQYPDRLAPEVRSAVAGALADFVTFRVPPATAGMVGAWVGLPREEAERWLPGLPTGHGVRLDAETGSARPISTGETVMVDEPLAWPGALQRTRQEFAVRAGPPGDLPGMDGATDRLLLAVLAAEEEGVVLEASHAPLAASALPGTSPAPEVLGDRWRDIVRQQYVEETVGGCRLTDAGRRRLGLTVPTGAVRESGEHRALLLATFRLFARKGYRIEIVRQGRFDTTLPDALFHQLPRRNGAAPVELAADLDRVRLGWAWRFFRGRDVHIEVEVSGALRAERIRRGYRKASDRGAFALFVVGDPARARRIRATLGRLSVGPDRAQVWTLMLPGRPRAPVSPTDRPNA